MTKSRDKVIFKIVAPDAWKEAEKAGVYHGSDHDKEDGFLHFSTASQLEETLRRYYPDGMPVQIVAVAAGPLGDALKYEHSPSRGEDFPHLYGSLPLVYEPSESATVLSALFTHVGQSIAPVALWSNWMSTGGDPENDPWLGRKPKQP